MSDISMQELKEELEIAKATGNPEAVALIERLIQEFEEEGYLEDGEEEEDCSGCGNCTCKSI